jgi:hypothetical protein
VATIFAIFPTLFIYFSPVVTYSPRKVCRRVLEFCMDS